MTETPLTFALPAKPMSKDHAELVSFLKDAPKSSIRIDAALTSVIPAQCLQILLSAEQKWTAAGLGFAVINVSDDCRRDLGLFGLSSAHFLNEVPT